MIEDCGGACGCFFLFSDYAYGINNVDEAK